MRHANGRHLRRGLPTLASAAAATAAGLWARPARADPTWQGTTSSSWTDTTNWLGGSAPAYGSTNAASRLNIYNFNATSGAAIVPAVYDPVAAGLAASTNTTFASARGLVVANAGSGDAGLVVDSGTLTIGGNSNPILANAQNGYITVNGGLLDSSSTTSTGFLMLFGNNAGIVNATITVGSGGEFRAKLLDLDNGNTNPSSTSGIVLNAGGVLTATGLADTQGKAIATLTFNGGTLRAGGSSATFLNALTNTTVVFNASGGTVDTNGFNVTIAAPLTGSTTSTGGGLSKVGLGTLTVTASNSYTGGTTIAAGAVTASNTSSLGTAGVTFTGNATLIASSVTLANAITINPGVTATLNGTSDYAGRFSGTIGGAGTLASSAYTLLTGSNSYSGGTQVNGFLLGINADAALGAVPSSLVTNNVVMNGGTLSTFSGSYANVTLNANRGIALVGTGTFDVGSANTFTINGPISGTGTLKAANSGGALALYGSNSYQGGTALSSGTVRAYNAVSSLGTGTTTITGTGILAVTGNTGTGAVVLGTDGTITGGGGATTSNSINTLTVGGTLNLSGGSYVVKLNLASATGGVALGSGASGGGTYSDKLILSGLLVANGSTGTALTISPLVLSPSPTPFQTYSFLIADNSGPNATGAFNSLLSRIAVPATDGRGDTLALSDSADGNQLYLDLTTVPTPEPTSLLLGGLALAPLALRRRRGPRSTAATM